MQSRKMKNIFLPKELNKNDATSICVDKQSGEMSTEMHWHSCAEIIHVQRIYAAFQRIWEAEFMYPLTAAEIAARVNISYSHMANLIRWERSATFNELLLKKRVDAAKKFSASAGITPHKYRTENRRLMPSASAVPAFSGLPEMPK